MDFSFKVQKACQPLVRKSPSHSLNCGELWGGWHKNPSFTANLNRNYSGDSFIPSKKTAVQDNSLLGKTKQFAQKLGILKNT